MANDKVKGSTFSKLSRIITLSVIEGGGIKDPENNVRLRLAIDKARAANMPNDNINRAIERGAGPDKSLIKEIIYEGFGPGGVAMMIQASTDNPNRTMSEVRIVMDKNHGKLASTGAVNYLFKKCALLIVKKEEASENQVFEAGEKLGAFDIDQDETRFYIYFPYENLGHIRDKIGDVKYESAELDYMPQNHVEVADEDKIRQLDALVSNLEALDDVHKVFTNL
jgi:YebC/PmpR family DNA-binding regulatory protein